MASRFQDLLAVSPGGLLSAAGRVKKKITRTSPAAAEQAIAKKLLFDTVPPRCLPESKLAEAPGGLHTRGLVGYESVTFPRRTDKKGKAATYIQVFSLGNFVP